MSRTPSSDLFDLIKSLTKSEKRLFKLHASRHSIGEKNAYVKLFDAIDRQAEYDEESLLRNAPWLQATDFRSMKSYLYELILRSLQPVLRQHSANAQVTYMTEKVWFLNHKKLYRQAGRMLERAKASAIKAGDLVRGLEILFQQSTLKVRMEETNSLERHEEIYRQQKMVLGWLEQNIEYYNLFMRIYYLHVRTHYPYSHEEMRELEEIMSSPLLQDEGMPPGSYPAMQFYEVHLRNAVIRRNAPEAYRYAQMKLAAIEQNPEWQKHMTYEYIYTLGVLLGLCVELDLYEEFEEKSRTLQGMYKEGDTYDTDVRANLLHTEFLYHVRRCRFDQACAMIPEIERFMHDCRERIEVSVCFDFSLAIASFSTMIGEYRQSLDWTGQILNYPQQEKYRYYMGSARMLNVINYIELNDESILESSVRSLHRFLTAGRTPHAFDLSLLSLFKRIAGMSNGGTMTEVLKKAQCELMMFRSAEPGLGWIGQFDMLAWLARHKA